MFKINDSTKFDNFINTPMYHCGHTSEYASCNVSADDMLGLLHVRHLLCHLACSVWTVFLLVITCTHWISLMITHLTEVLIVIQCYKRPYFVRYPSILIPGQKSYEEESTNRNTVMILQEDKRSENTLNKCRPKALPEHINLEQGKDFCVFSRSLNCV